MQHYFGCYLIVIDIGRKEHACTLSKAGVVKKNAKGVKDGDSTKYWTDADGIIIRTERY